MAVQWGSFTLVGAEAQGSTVTTWRDILLLKKKGKGQQHIESLDSQLGSEYSVPQTEAYPEHLDNNLNSHNISKSSNSEEEPFNDIEEFIIDYIPQ